MLNCIGRQVDENLATTYVRTARRRETTQFQARGTQLSHANELRTPYLLSVESKLIHVTAFSPCACENSNTERPVSKSHTFITCMKRVLNR